jgi:hypothetical protein
MKGTWSEVVKQHINSQLAFRVSYGKDTDINPIFHTVLHDEEDERIDQIAKIYTISFLVKQNYNIRWSDERIEDALISDHFGIGIYGARVAYGTRHHIWKPDSHFYLGDFLTRKQIALDDTKAMKEIEAKLINRTKLAIDIMQDLTEQKPFRKYQPPPSREYQLLIASLLSMSPLKKWTDVNEEIKNWKNIDKFIEKLDIPRTIIKFS